MVLRDASASKNGAGRNFASCACPVSRALCITSLAPIIGPHHLGEGVKQLGGVFFTKPGQSGSGKFEK